MGVRYVNLIKTLIEPAQKIENALIELYAAFVLAAASGIQIDKIGDRVGQKRNGMSDSDYKLAIRARVLTNRSTGSFSDLKRIALIFTDTFKVEAGGGVAFVDVGIMSDSRAALLFSFLNKAVAATVRLQMFYHSEIDANTFTLASAAITTSTISGGTVSVQDGLNLPDFGTVTVGMGTPLQENATYTSRTATEIVGLTAINVHPIGTAIQVNNPALGFDNGKFATLLETV